MHRWPTSGLLVAVAGLASSMLLAQACTPNAGKKRPESPSEVFSDEVWAKHEATLVKDLGPTALVPSREGAPGHPAYIPLEPALLDRITFVGVPVADLRKLLRTFKPPYIANQPSGATSYRMWPNVDRCHFLFLSLEWESDDALVPRIVKEAVVQGGKCPEY